LKPAGKPAIAAACVVLVLFLLPVIPITVTVLSCEAATIFPPSGCQQRSEMASSSVTYAFFGLGSVYVPNYSATSRSYCLMYGNPGTMCGWVMHRAGQMMMAPV